MTDGVTEERTRNPCDNSKALYRTQCNGLSAIIPYNRYKISLHNKLEYT